MFDFLRALTPASAHVHERMYVMESSHVGPAYLVAVRAPAGMVAVQLDSDLRIWPAERPLQSQRMGGALRSACSTPHKH